MDILIVIACCIIPLCVSVFAFTQRKRNFDAINERESLTYTLQKEDELYQVKRTKSALKRKDRTNQRRKSVQFNEVVLEVIDLFNDEEPEKPYYSKVIRSSLKHEKKEVPIRCSKTIFPKTIINEYNGEVINFSDLNKEEKIEETEDTTKSIFSNSELPEIVVIKNDEKSDNRKDKPELFEQNKNGIAETVITSMANQSINSNLININGELKQKANTLPRRSRPNYKGHKRQSSVRLTCIY